MRGCNSARPFRSAVAAALTRHLSANAGEHLYPRMRPRPPDHGRTVPTSLHRALVVVLGKKENITKHNHAWNAESIEAERKRGTETIIERTLTGKVRMNAYKDRSPRQSERKRRKELELSEVHGMCLWNPGMRSRYAVATGEEEKQHEERCPHQQKRIGDSKRRTTRHNEEDSTIRATCSKHVVVLNHACVS